MGISDFFPENKWILDGTEDGGPLIEGEYVGQNLTEDIRGNWSETPTLGREQPILQFINGECDKLTMDVKAWAKFHDPTGLLSAAALALGIDPKWGDIGDFVEQIKALPRKDPDKGRPFIFLFTMGSQIAQTVIVESVGGVRYDPIRPFDGTLRGALFRFTLKRYTPYGQEAFSTRTNESLVVFAREGEMYEQITERVYGDAAVGEALRRRNPDKTSLSAGDQIHVPPQRTLAKEVKPLTPQSLALKRNDAQRELLLDALRVRGVSVDSFIIRNE
jgi:hypothetical protein